MILSHKVNQITKSRYIFFFDESVNILNTLLRASLRIAPCFEPKPAATNT